MLARIGDRHLVLVNDAYVDAVICHLHESDHVSITFQTSWLEWSVLTRDIEWWLFPNTPAGEEQLLETAVAHDINLEAGKLRVVSKPAA